MEETVAGVMAEQILAKHLEGKVYELYGVVNEAANGQGRGKRRWKERGDKEGWDGKWILNSLSTWGT
jgi:hypothetical protein